MIARRHALTGIISGCVTVLLVFSAIRFRMGFPEIALFAILLFSLAYFGQLLILWSWRSITSQNAITGCLFAGYMGAFALVELLIETPDWFRFSAIVGFLLLVALHGRAVTGEREAA